MKITQEGRVTLYDFEPTAGSVADEVLTGLRRSPKALPCKLFYDERGSQLFDEICELDEYYPTRTEVAILTRYGAEMAALIGPRARIVELGSGSSTKTPLLLDRLQEPAAYVPLDISRAPLLESSQLLAARYPELPVLAVCADYTQPLELPMPPGPVARTVAFFPGSTIGNLEPPDAERFLRRIRGWCGPGGGLLIGVDQKKSPAILEPAYNDRRGVTAAFNLNLLVHINRELGADFDRDGFQHRAIYDQTRGCIEMRLISRRPQTVHVLDESFAFAEGEIIVTEHSYKYEIGEFGALAERAGFAVERAWTDDNRLFGVLFLRVRD